jgi:hypothetical protein
MDFARVILPPYFYPDNIWRTSQGTAMTLATPTFSYTSFQAHRRLASGPLHVVALAVKLAEEQGSTKPILVFNDSTGRAGDGDTRGSDEEVLARYAAPGAEPVGDAFAAPDLPRGRGRPKLGVVAREVTLLPRHWEWLEAQPGGPSATLRKLVEAARRSGTEHDQTRTRQERAYHFTSAMAGNMPGFEEAMRALFANDPVKFAEHSAAWPDDVRDYATRLAFAQ